MKKIIYAVIYSCLCILYICSCEKKEPLVSPIPDELMQKIIAELELEDDFSGVVYKSDSATQKLTEKELQEFYAGQTGEAREAIELNKIEKYSIRLGTENSAYEIGIFKVFDKSSSVKYVEKIVKNRLLAVQQKFKNFNPEDIYAQTQITAANSGEVRTYGKYIYYIIHPDKDRIFEKIENIFRDN